ncbi:hypothetical protein D3C78_1795880 [compost metagenome]
MGRQQRLVDIQDAGAVRNAGLKNAVVDGELLDHAIQRFTAQRGMRADQLPTRDDNLTVQKLIGQDRML